MGNKYKQRAHFNPSGQWFCRHTIHYLHSSSPSLLSTMQIIPLLTSPPHFSKERKQTVAYFYHPYKEHTSASAPSGWRTIKLPKKDRQKEKKQNEGRKEQHGTKGSGSWAREWAMELGNVLFLLLLLILLLPLLLLIVLTWASNRGTHTRHFVFFFLLPSLGLLFQIFGCVFVLVSSRELCVLCFECASECSSVGSEWVSELLASC